MFVVRAAALGLRRSRIHSFISASLRCSGQPGVRRRINSISRFEFMHASDTLTREATSLIKFRSSPWTSFSSPQYLITSKGSCENYPPPHASLLCFSSRRCFPLHWRVFVLFLSPVWQLQAPAVLSLSRASVSLRLLSSLSVPDKLAV